MLEGALLGLADLFAHSVPAIAGFIGGVAGTFFVVRLQAWRARRRVDEIKRRVQGK
jgi:hypothetical protein